MKCHFAALLLNTYLTRRTAEGHWNCNIHLKSEDFADDVQYAKLNQLFRKNTSPFLSPASHGDNVRAHRHLYHVLWIRRPLFRDGVDYLHCQQSSGWLQCMNSSLQGITHSVNCGMCHSQEAKQIVCG